MMSCLFSCARGVLRVLGGEPVTLEQAYARVDAQQDPWCVQDDQSKRWEEEAREGIACIADFAIPYLQGESKIATHLGCGLHELSQVLCKRGWGVHAVDSSEKVLAICKKSFADVDSVQFHQTSIEDFVFPERVDLIYTDALPYVEPERFRAVWEKAIVALKEGGLFVGTFSPSFGLKATDNPRTKHLGVWHVNEGEVRALLKEVGEVLYCRDNLEGGSRKIRFVVQKITPRHRKEL